MRLIYKQAINNDGYVGQIIFFNINTKGTKRSRGVARNFSEVRTLPQMLLNKPPPPAKYPKRFHCI